MATLPGHLFALRSSDRVAKAPSIRLGVTLTILVLAAFGAFTGWRNLRRPDADHVWGEAEASIQAGRLDEAKAGLSRLESLRRPTPEDWILRAQVATALKHDDEALSALEHVPKDHAMGAQARFMAGLIERNRNRLRPAEAAFREAIALDPGLVRAHRALVFLFGVQVRRREVDAEFKALARLTALTHHDLFTWGLMHFDDWGPEVAYDLEAFIKADPFDRHSRLALANLFVDIPDLESKFEEALAPLSDDDAEACALRIRLKLNRGRVDEAIALLDQAPAGHPKLARLRGHVALMRGDPAAAIHHFQEALSDEPYDRVSLTELGKALLLKGEKTAAQGYLARARRLDDVYNLINLVREPGHENQAPDLARLGRTCEAAGLHDEARGWYLLAIGRDPLDAESQQSLRRLGETGTQ